MTSEGEELKLIDAQPFDDQEARRWANWQLTPIEGSSSPYLVGTNQRGAASLLSAMARIKELEKQVEAARAEGYQEGVEDAMKLINTNGSQLIYVSAVNEMLSGLKRRSETTTRPSESSQPAMMSLWGIGKPLDQ